MLQLFALQSSIQLGRQVAAELGLPLSPIEETDFADGEHKARPLESAAGKRAVVIQSLYGEPARSVDDKLMRLLLFIGALRDAGAGSVTAVAPYLCYARQDRRTEPGEPLSIRYLAQMLEALRVDCLIVMDVHNRAAFQNAFHCLTLDVSAADLFAEYLAERLPPRSAVVLSPDAGGTKRAEMFRRLLAVKLGAEVGSAYMEKYRGSGGLSGDSVVGEVAGKTVVIFDDLISTGSTVLRAAEHCMDRGAEAVYAAATHGVFVEGAARRLCRSPSLKELVITDTVKSSAEDAAEIGTKRILAAAPVLAQAIVETSS